MRKTQKELEWSVTLKLTEIEQQVTSLWSEIAHLQSELATKLHTIDRCSCEGGDNYSLQEGIGEMALMVQTLQTTSYSGTFIWKIPEVQNRRDEARSG